MGMSPDPPHMPRPISCAARKKKMQRGDHGGVQINLPNQSDSASSIVAGSAMLVAGSHNLLDRCAALDSTCERCGGLWVRSRGASAVGRKKWCGPTSDIPRRCRCLARCAAQRLLLEEEKRAGQNFAQTKFRKLGEHQALRSAQDVERKPLPRATAQTDRSRPGWHGLSDRVRAAMRRLLLARQLRHDAKSSRA